MRYRWAIVLLILVGLAVVGRFASQEELPGDPTSIPQATVEATLVPTQVTTGEFDITAWDLDGDGSFSTSELGPAAVAYADTLEFAPGYEFDPYRFGNEYQHRSSTSWSIESVEPVVIKAQTCSWVQYWIDSTDVGDDRAAEAAVEMLTVLQPNDALGDLAEPIGFMLEAARAGDVERVEELFTGARCHITFFVDDSIGPQGVESFHHR